MEQQSMGIEYLSTPLTTLHGNEKVYPWSSIGDRLNPGGCEIQYAGIEGLALKRTYTSKWKNTLLGILTGGIGAVLLAPLAVSKHVKQCSPERVKKVVRVTRPFSSNGRSLPEELKNNPPERETIYHIFVESDNAAVDVHVFKLLIQGFSTPQSYEEAHNQLEKIMASAIPVDVIFDEESSEINKLKY